jgi:hypothetical protein
MHTHTPPQQQQQKQQQQTQRARCRPLHKHIPPKPQPRAGDCRISPATDFLLQIFQPSSPMPTKCAASASTNSVSWSSMVRHRISRT